MKLGVVVAGVCAVIVSTYLVIILASPREEIAKTTPHVEGAPQRGEDFPPLAKGPPYPKAMIDETDYEFGPMEVGEERMHEFTIRNEGEAPLVIKQGPTTCQCTVSNLETGELAVGQSAKITLKWKPTGQAEHFNKGAEIRTNDPDHTSIQLHVIGMVAPRMVTAPEKTWESPDVLEGEPTTLTGLILSPVADRFEVVALESPTPLMTAECLPIDTRQLAVKNGRSGYLIRVTLSPEVPIGMFSYPLTIKTDLPARKADGKLGTEGIEMSVLVTGHRRGPIRIIGSKDWDERNMAVVLGSFDAAVGKKVSLMMFVRGAGAGEFQLTGAPEAQPAALTATVEREGKSTVSGKQVRYRLDVEYPAGSPKASCRSDNPGKIRLRTNLPGAPEIEFLVYFAAY
jgi:hypothetical protein